MLHVFWLLLGLGLVYADTVTIREDQRKKLKFYGTTLNIVPDVGDFSDYPKPINEYPVPPKRYQWFSINFGRFEKTFYVYTIESTNQVFLTNATDWTQRITEFSVSSGKLTIKYADGKHENVQSNEIKFKKNGTYNSISISVPIGSPRAFNLTTKRVEEIKYSTKYFETTHAPRITSTVNSDYERFTPISDEDEFITVEN